MVKYAEPGTLAESEPLSSWVQSPVRRICDIVLVVAILPALVPLCLAIALAVRCSSRDPVFFLQKRVGRNGNLFTIVKFRTMTSSANGRQTMIATISDGRITKLGSHLRRWKLDELPQFVNVLRGEMSLVGPRPRVPEQQIAVMRCRPGITGPSALAFAQEDVFLAAVPPHQLHKYYRSVLLPLKHRLDSSYMAEATWLSDLKIVRQTVLRQWARVSTTMGIGFHGEIVRADLGRVELDHVERRALRLDHENWPHLPATSVRSTDAADSMALLMRADTGV
jgi:lipopolysaccharide/colanic/teichoic acid biosynthesis glycosyltransferase